MKTLNNKVDTMYSQMIRTFYEDAAHAMSG